MRVRRIMLLITIKTVIRHVEINNSKCPSLMSWEIRLKVWFGWLHFTSYRQRGHLEMAQQLTVSWEGRAVVKLVKYTVPTGNRTPGRRMAVHYAWSSMSQAWNPISLKCTVKIGPTKYVMKYLGTQI